ncbi:MAG UNVERIFIED_CONTAM: hypothetical protein LVR18_17195 [Planctomycetaceae bacterium]
MGSLSSDYCEFSGSIGYYESSGHAHAAIPSVAGIVPATGSLSGDDCESSGASGYDESSGHAHAAPPVLRGLSPRLGR